MNAWQWLDTSAAVAAMTAPLVACRQLAFDTEFVRRTTFFPIPGLLQLGDGTDCWLIDPVAPGHTSAELLAPLANLLRQSSVQTVMHSAQEDLELMHLLWGGPPCAHLFDTQVAAAFLGAGLQLSYQKLCEQFLGVHVAKAETTSDWCARPLSAAQCEYAAEDVRHLLVIADLLREQLQQRGLLQWCEQDCADALVQAGRSVDPQQAWRDIGLAWQLSRRSLAVLKVLAVWREQVARTEDVPRSFLFKDVLLVELARRPLTQRTQLAAIEGVHGKVLRLHGDAVLALMADAWRTPEADWPQALPAPLPREAKALLSALKQAAETVATQQGVPVEVLCRKRHIEAMADHWTLVDVEGWPAAVSGWRGTLLEPAMREVAVAFREELLQWQQLRLRAVVKDD